MSRDLANTVVKSLRNWFVDHLADTVWSAIIGGVAIVLFLPFDQDALTFVLVVFAVGGIFASLARKHFLIITVAFVLIAALTNALVPILRTTDDVYLARCPTLLPCIRTVAVRSRLGHAKIYPISDPLKWYLWTKLVPQFVAIRTIESGVSPAGQVILHSPTEREMARLLGDHDTTLSTPLYLRVPIDFLTIDFRTGADGKLAAKIVYNHRPRVRILEWRAPTDLNRPSVFSAVGSADEFESIAREAVRADLVFRNLLAGNNYEVWSNIQKQTDPSLREIVRGKLITSGLMDESFRGNVFSISKLFALQAALPSLGLFHQTFGDKDELFSAAIVHYSNMLLAQESEGPRNPSNLNFDIRDAHYFESELLWFFKLSAKAQDSDNARQEAQATLAKWRTLIQGQAAGPVAADPVKAREFHDRQLRATDAPTNISTLKRLDMTHSDGLEFEKAILSSAVDLFDQISLAQLELATLSAPADYSIHGAMTEGSLGLVDDPRLNTYSHFPITGIDPKTAIVQTHLREAQQRVSNVLESIQYLSTLTERVSPSAKEIIRAELRAVGEATQVLIMAMDAALGRGMRVPRLVDPVGWVVQQASHSDGRTNIGIGEPLFESSVGSLGLECEYYDRPFVAHFFAEMLNNVAMLANDKNHKGQTELLWKDYGEGCSDFVPGLMLLHSMLRLQGDARADVTRGKIDGFVGGDASWLQDLDRAKGQPKLFEGRLPMDRLRSSH